jgi:hypothetical protein
MFEQGKKMKIKWPLVGTFVLSLCVAFSLLSLNSCRRERRLTAAEWKQIAEDERAKFRACIPDTKLESKVHLALAGIQNEPNQTSVKLVAYALQEPTEFDLPQYSMSRGRWLINERGRSYIRDEQCNEYKLKDRTPAVGKVPDSGRIQLKAGEFYEVTLSFPRLPEEVRQGVLVYGNWVMPFVLQ